MRDPKSPGKARGKLAVPLPTPHMSGFSTTGQWAPSHLLPFFSQCLRWRGNFFEAASRWEANSCSQGMACSRIPPGTGSVSTSPQTSKKRKRKKAKRAPGRGRQLRIAPCLLPSPLPRKLPPQSAGQRSGAACCPGGSPAGGRADSCRLGAPQMQVPS